MQAYARERVETALWNPRRVGAVAALTFVPVFQTNSSQQFQHKILILHYKYTSKIHSFLYDKALKQKLTFDMSSKVGKLNKTISPPTKMGLVRKESMLLKNITN